MDFNRGNKIYEGTNKFLSYFNSIINMEYPEELELSNKIFREARERNYHSLIREGVVERRGIERRYFLLNQINQILQQSMGLEELFNYTYKHFK